MHKGEATIIIECHTAEEVRKLLDLVDSVLKTFTYDPSVQYLETHMHINEKE